MKKLLALALVVVLTLPLAAMASAATFDPYVGGRITWSYMSVEEDNGLYGDDVTKDTPATLNNSGIKMLLKGKISDEETGTWGAIGAQIDGWPNDRDLNGPSAIYDFGVNFDSVGIWYTNWENENMKRGQDRIRDIASAKYHADPMFDHALGNAIGVDYNNDTVKINFGYVVDKNVDLDLNMMAAAATFKFDGGDVHLGYFNGEEGFNPYNLYDYGTFDVTEINVGCNYKLGFGSIAVDYVSKTLGEDKYGNELKDLANWDGGSQIQAKVSFTDLRLDVTVLLDDKYTFYLDGGTGYVLRYGINDKAYVGYAALNANDSDEADLGNMTDLYVGYKFGVLDLRAGTGTKGDLKDNGVFYVSCYASFW